ncbi:hypothetical protein [Kangiella shandongensis]|uniref:hypothetical protein n=1 Tax=Kangiella shandongensis TaxID=2763258 RepID=UPI001CC144FD|nr:hypothetical protein [Kangiella shandongensis]
MDIAQKSLMDRGSAPNSELLSFLDYSPMGYPMGDELIPLAEMFSGKETENADADDEEPKITNLDIQLDDAKAHLHDKLLNVSPELGSRVSLSNDYPILNRVYETFLRHSEFAGKVQADSEQLTQAENFLFPKNEQGIPEESDVYKRYVDYSEQCFELELKIAEATSSGTSSVAELLKQKLSRVQAEWVTLGQKHQVEDALEILRTADAKAGYEDERNGFIELLESRLRTRLGSSENYAAVTISPLKPLLEPEENGLWQRLTLTAEDIKSHLTPDICELFGVDDEELSYVMKCFKSASMEYLRVFLSREWLSKDFLNARYWRNSTSTLSDGKGEGEIPTAISSAFFIKSAELDLSQGVDIDEVGSIRSHDKKRVMVFNTVKTPLMHALIQNDKKEVTGSKKKKLIDTQALKKLQSVKVLQSREKRKLKTAKRIKLSPRLLQTQFKPAITNRKLQKKKKKARVKSTMINRVHGLKLQPRMILHTIKNPKKVKRLNVTGRVEHNGFVSAGDLNLSYTLLDKNENELDTKNIKLTTQGEHLRFKLKVTNNQHPDGAKGSLADSVKITLQNLDGDELMTKSFEFRVKNKKVSVSWSASQGSIEMALSSDVTPTLFAYGLEVLPKSPNPDGSLFKN